MLGIANAIINNLLNNVFHAIWFYILTTNPKHSKQKMIMFCAISVVIAELLSLFTILGFGVEGKAFTLLYIAGSLVYIALYVFILQGGSKLKAFFIFFTYICAWAAVYVVSMILYNNVFGKWEPSIWIIRTFFNLILLLLYQLVFRRKIEKSGVAIEKASPMLVIVSGMAYFLLPILMIIYAFSEQNNLSLAATLFLLIFSVVVYVLMFSFIKHIARENELTAIEMQNKYLSDAVKNFEMQEKEIQQKRHDYRHHNALLAEYAKNGDTDAIIEYLNAYEKKEERKDKRLCANKTVDYILRSFLQKAENAGIEMTVNTAMHKETTVADTDLVAMVANMLENAINGCEKAHGQKKIDISVYHKDFKLVLLCKNTCTKNVKFENGIPVRKLGGGVGVQSMIASSDKYGGVYDFSLENGIFTCMFILNDVKSANCPLENANYP